MEEIAAVGFVVALALVCLGGLMYSVGANSTMQQVMTECEKFGAFRNGDDVYRCEVRK
jgi:hypothetical protein